MSEAPRRRRRVRSTQSRSDAVMGDAVVGDAVVGDAAVNDAVIGDGAGEGAAVPDTTKVVAEAGVTAHISHTSAATEDPAVWAVEPVQADTLPAERGLRGLVGGGSSQVTPTAALRARDAARARPEDLARAEADLTIVRRNWSPRD